MKVKTQKTLPKKVQFITESFVQVFYLERITI